MPQGKKPTTKKGKQEKVHRVMSEFKSGELTSGSKHGPKVTSRDQAVAIAMSESGQSKKKKGRRAQKSKKSR
jgi:hypothetical protein